MKPVSGDREHLPAHRDASGHCHGHRAPDAGSAQRDRWGGGQG